MASNNSSNERRVDLGKSCWNAFLGWGISTLLLWLLNRNNSSSSSDNSQEPSKYTDSNVNQIGSAIPVVLGRATVKNPLVSFYGDFDYRPYTEEYGMHADISWSSILIPLLITIIAILITPNSVIVATPAGPGAGTENTQGAKNQMIMMAIFNALLTILTMLFSNHMGKTTIQKGFKYYLGWQHIICWTGDNIGLKRIWMNVYDPDVEESTEQGVWDNNNHIAWKQNNVNGIVAHIDDEDMFGGVDEGGGFVGDVRVYFGTTTQPNDSWMVSQMSKSSNIPSELKGLTPKYPMFVTAVIPKAYIGKQATIPEMWFEVVNYPNGLAKSYRGNSMNWYKIGEDSNPAEVIFEILKNTYWGCGYSADRVDIESLLALGDTAVKEGMGVSCLINTSNSAGDYINKILSHINGVCYDNPKTGKLTFKLIRNDYDENSLPIFSVNNCASMDFSRLDWSETVNMVTANFTYADQKYDTGTIMVSDLANMRITHNSVEKSIDASYFTTENNAKTYAKTQLLSLAYPLASVSFEASRDAYNLTLGQPIIINWAPYGISRQIFRVTDIDYGSLLDGRISVTAVEDVFGFEKTDYTDTGSIGWENLPQLPEYVSVFKYLEAPYELSMSLDTYIYGYASRPSESSVYWHNWRSVGGNYIKTMSTSQWSTVGRLNYLLPEYYNDDISGFTVRPVGYGGSDNIKDKQLVINKEPTKYNESSGLNLLVIDDEIISYKEIVSLLNGDYQIKGVVRGVFDTLPEAHNANSFVYFLDNRQSITGGSPAVISGKFSNESLEITSESIDYKQDFEYNRVYSFNTVCRAEAPTIMGNLQFGGDKGSITSFAYNYPATTKFSSNVIFRFNARNKFNNYGIVRQMDSSVLPENTTDIVINCKCLDVDFSLTYPAITASNTPIEDITLKWADFCSNMLNKTQVINSVSLSIYTYNRTKKIKSFASYEKSIIYVMPTLVGIVGNVADVQTYADTLVQTSQIEVPATSVSPKFYLSYQDAALIFVGSSYTSGVSVGQGIVGQDGNTWYITNNECYVIDGIDSSGKAVIHKIDIDEYYTFGSKFTTLASNTTKYYRYRGTTNGWVLYTPY